MENTAKSRSYTANKKNFNLYWNLEAIISIADKIQPNTELTDILEKTALSNDYTIREKTSKTAKVFEFFRILKLLENDENIYVRKYL